MRVVSCESGVMFLHISSSVVVAMAGVSPLVCDRRVVGVAMEIDQSAEVSVER